MFYIWLAVLAYIVFGGALAEFLEQTGQVGRFCHDPLLNPDQTSATYETCKPCRLYGSIFGIIEIGNCSNKILNFLTLLFVSIPRIAVIMLGMLVYVLVEPLRDWAPVLFGLPALLTLLAVRRFLDKDKNVVRLIHGLLWSAYFALAIQWGLTS